MPDVTVKFVNFVNFVDFSRRFGGEGAKRMGAVNFVNFAASPGHGWRGIAAPANAEA